MNRCATQNRTHIHCVGIGRRIRGGESWRAPTRQDYSENCPTQANTSLNGPPGLLRDTLGFPWLVFAGGGVDAGVWEHQPGYRLSSDDVGLDDFFYVIGCYVSVPSCFWVDHHRWAVFALFQAAGFVGSDFGAGDSVFGQFLFE